DEGPVDELAFRLRLEIGEQCVDEVEAGLDREDLSFGDRRRVAEERVLFLRIDGPAADVVRLQAERVPETVRIEHAADSLRVDLLDRPFRETCVFEDGADL